MSAGRKGKTNATDPSYRNTLDQKVGVQVNGFFMCLQPGSRYKRAFIIGCDRSPYRTRLPKKKDRNEEVMDI